ncbi:ISNCY family transposase [uncultured Sphingomonas sp.]|uniref:ISNCY family transposase n=1 Tax=uncultured Sphingomonas sp. TaxID=158754 RepID=UPI0025F8ABC5|nr:ISNCY family transposase [uncultured Sphingomonas sp.]
MSRRRGRPSNRRLSNAIRGEVVALVRENYADFGPTLAREYLAERHGLGLARETLRQIMMEAGLWKAKVAKRAQLHQPRYRRDCRGELVQVDGSKHWWFEDRGPQCTLLVFIDDATSELMHLEMVESESTFSYMRATRTYLERHGKPIALYTDKHSAFRNNTASANGDGMTHLGRALDRLNIELICANSPQAKRRVERANATLQDRLVKAMRLHHISTIDQANAFLPSYMAQHNRRFAKAPFDPRDLHRPLAIHDDLEAELVWREQRTVTAALTLHYNKAMFILEPSPAARVLARKKVDVCEYPDGRLEIQHEGTALPYRMFDKMRRVNQAAVVDNKHLDAALALARVMHQAQPHHAKRNNNEPARSAQPAGLFKAPSPPLSGEKLDRRTLGNSRLKRGPCLSNEELVARGIGEYAR